MERELLSFVSPWWHIRSSLPSGRLTTTPKSSQGFPENGKTSMTQPSTTSQFCNKANLWGPGRSRQGDRGRDRSRQSWFLGCKLGCFVRSSRWGRLSRGIFGLAPRAHRRFDDAGENMENLFTIASYYLLSYKTFTKFLPSWSRGGLPRPNRWWFRCCWPEK